jgi:hypothetical protein
MLVDLLAALLVTTVLEHTSHLRKGQILDPGPAVSTEEARQRSTVPTRCPEFQRY